MRNRAIKPGRNLNVLQFNQKELSRHHFYVQVNPYPKSQQNDFGSEIYNPIHKNYLPDGSGTDEHELPSVDNADLEGNQTTQANPLRYRPAHYVPFKVPLYDEQYSQIQQDVYSDLKEQGKATSADKPDPLYRWYYRPELQFSQYNFDAKSLIVNQIDDEGEESTAEIEIEDDGTDFGPIFDSYTDSVELLFDLLGPQLDRLPPLENDREFVLSLGGEEAIATIGADGKVVFNNPDHLARLNSEDLLSLRLYLNGDAGNVLWEYQMAGFSSFWSIYPNQQPEQIRNAVSVEEAVAYSLGLDIGNAIAEMANTIHLIPAANAEDPVIDAEDEQEYYLLGGMRVKLLFKPEVNSSLGKVDYMTWRTNKGKFYVDNNPSIAALGGHRTIVNATHDEGITVETYFQPDDWITNFNGEITASVKYENSPVPKNYKFKLKTRVLQPKSPTPMQGADVAMLEGLLWQLGISPQKGSPGSQGARINSSTTGSGASNTKNCQGTAADDRTKFYIGWSVCNKKAVSLEAMVRRFRSRNGLAESGEVNNNVLEALGRDYSLYRKATFKYEDTPIMSQSHASFDTWLDNSVKIWTDGLESSVSSGVYSEEIHNGILTLAGNSTAGKGRKELLKHWVSHESKYHWGSNNAAKTGGAYQPTPFRMSEGGADEHGSLSYSQVLYTYKYGSNPCTAHKDNGLNLYDPEDNLKTMVVHSAAKSNCKGGLYRAFGESTLAEPYALGSLNTRNINELVGYLKADGTVKKITELKEDNYELLAKGIGIYNGVPKWFRNNTWPFILKYFKHGGSKGENIIATYGCASCEYSIEIRNGRGAESSFGMNYRTYVWKGGDTLQDINGNGLKDPGEVETPWCFKYGEKEWIEKKVFQDIKDDADLYDEDGLVKEQIGAMNCNTGVEL